MIDFDHSSTAEVNAENSCAGCCAETGCELATPTIRSRDSALIKCGIGPFCTTPAVPAHDDVPAVPAIWPGAFDLTSVGELIPVYRKQTEYFHYVYSSSQNQAANHHGTGGTIDKSASVSYTRAINETLTREFIPQQRRDGYAASNFPEGPCTPLVSIVPPDAPSGLDAAVGTLASGITAPDPDWHLTPVLLSWGDNRPTTPTDFIDSYGPKMGSFEVLVDGTAAAGDPVPLGDDWDPAKLQIYLSDTDDSCHEVCVRAVLPSGAKGKWSEPVPFRIGGVTCCVPAIYGDCVPSGVLGNWQTNNPSQAGFSGTRTYDGDTSTVSNFTCESFDPIPEDVTDGPSDVTGPLDTVETVTASTWKAVSTTTDSLDSGDITDVAATGVNATGVTVDGSGNITGGTVTGGTLTGGNVTGGGTLVGGPFTGTLTGGTITGGTVDGSGNLVGGTISGASLTDSKTGGGIDYGDPDPDFRGWRTAGRSFAGTIVKTHAATGAGRYYEPAIELSDDINTGHDGAAEIFTELAATLAAYPVVYGWGLTIAGAWAQTSGDPATRGSRTPPAGAATATAYWPVTNGTLTTGPIEMAVRVREMRLSWTVPENHDANNYGVRWRIGFFSDKWLDWRTGYYAFSKALYDFFQAPEPGDPDYPVIGDFSESEHPADDLAAVIDALQKDPRVFPPSGWSLSDGLYHKGDEELTETQLRDRYNLREDPGTAPTAPVLVGDPFEWVWDSEQEAVDPETVDECDPTFEARQPAPEPVREDFPDTPEGLIAFTSAHDAWDTARLAAIDRSKRTSGWYVITPPSLPSVPGSFYVCDVRHICDMENPTGIIENYDHRFPTTELPTLDPAEFDPAVYAVWF